MPAESRRPFVIVRRFAAVVGTMDRQGTSGVPFDVEGSGYGFRVVKTITAGDAEMPTTCRMQRPG